ncbi:MAG: hypothetical protein NDI61_08585 [Bdellovibrionaceae bacterium]|nr:hypothetical protein [Pseudobdellovibrionaceae bacterium]
MSNSKLLLFTTITLALAAAPEGRVAFAARGPVPRPIQPQPPAVEPAEMPGLPGVKGTGTGSGAGVAGPDSGRGPASSVPAAESRPAAAPSAVPVAVTVTRVVGEVAEQIITSREVQLNDVIEQAAFGRLPGMTSIRVLKSTEKTFPGDVDAVLREWAIYLEARSFETGEVGRAELQKSLRAVQEAVSGVEVWSQLEPSSQEIMDILERKIIAKRFLRLKTDSAQVPITDAEALAYYKKNRLKFGNLPFTSFRENIKTFLIKQQMDRRLQDWSQVLERKYKVRNFIAG